MELVTLLLGGNSGDMLLNIHKATSEIANRMGVVVKSTTIHQTKSWGFDADDFFNQVLVVETVLSPLDLLHTIWDIENLFGRGRTTDKEEIEKFEKRERGEIGYSSRQMDIDILYYGDLELKTELLTIPHPRIGEREFVLKLLDEINPPTAR